MSLKEAEGDRAGGKNDARDKNKQECAGLGEVNISEG